MQGVEKMEFHGGELSIDVNFAIRILQAPVKMG